MNQRVVLVAFACVLCFGMGFLFGSKRNQRVLIDEYKVAVSNFMRLREKGGDSPLREYAKAKYYYYANRVPAEYFPSQGDFGPINSLLLSNVTIGKGPTTPEEEYRRFKEREQNLHRKN